MNDLQASSGIHGRQFAEQCDQLLRHYGYALDGRKVLRHLGVEIDGAPGDTQRLEHL